MEETDLNPEMSFTVSSLCLQKNKKKFTLLLQEHEEE
jgi:hypothetical protein